MARKSSPAIRYTLIAIGVLLLAITPVIGPIPGPGGLITFGGGMVLILRNSDWARRQFARLKRRYPRFGHYSDMALRRASWKRRRERAAREAEIAKAEAAMLGFGQEPR